MQHFQTFIARHRTRRRAQNLKIVQYVGFNTGKAGFCRRQIVGFDTECDILVLHKPVVAFRKLIFQHIPVLGTDRIKSVVLCRDIDSLFRFAAHCPLIDKRELHRHGSVKVVEKIAPVFKDSGLVVRLCKLIVYIFKGDGFRVFLFRHAANPVRVHGKVGDCLLCGVGFPVALCLSDNLGYLLFFGAGQFALRVSLSASRRAVGCFCLLQSLIPPFQVFSAVPEQSIDFQSDRVALLGQ